MEDEEDFVFFGTPIEREEDTSARKRKAVGDAGQLRSLPPWKQEVRDEEGRRRLHGAFTGGFSAGYYNTVGSKEGWAPRTFMSSRKNRAEVKEQSIYNFLDDDDLKDMGGHALETSTQFDTFGFTAAEVARKQAEKEQQKRPSAIPGPIPDEIILPAASSIGIKLLQKMGWRHGHSIKETQAESLYDARREARKAFLAFSGNLERAEKAQIESSRSESEDFTERYNDGRYASQSIPVYVTNPKQDLHGVGYDPFKHAPEFRDRKRLLDSSSKDRGSKSMLSSRSNILASNSGKYAPGFGIGALEELDVEDEDIYGVEDKDIYVTGFELEETIEVEPSKLGKDSKYQLEESKAGILRGFRVVSDSDYAIERFHPPVIPPDFVPRHEFHLPLDAENKIAEAPPAEVPPPEDNSLKVLIDGFAALVARCGKLFEDLSKEKNKSDPLFSFLTGGNGHQYYARKLWEQKQKHADQQKQEDMNSSSYIEKMTAERRGRILGEKSLDRSADSTPSVTLQTQFNLLETFTEPASQVGLSDKIKPFEHEPAKQERFEQFLKDKYQGGLRSVTYGSANKMSEDNRARERLEFEAAAYAIEKAKRNRGANTSSVQQTNNLLGSGNKLFISSAGIEQNQTSQDIGKMNGTFPKREEFQWRPSPILCKRFDIMDPFIGKPPPLPRARSKMDSLIFTVDLSKNTASKDDGGAKRDKLPISQPDIQDRESQLAAEEVVMEPSTTNVQRPVDLYKAIFSDDSDDDGDNSSHNKEDDPEKKTEGANTTLNRLIAGDFLESLGKELGLEVPPDTDSFYRTNSSASAMESGGRGVKRNPLENDKSTFTVKVEDRETIAVKPGSPKLSMDMNFPGTSYMTNKDVGPFDDHRSSHANSRRENMGVTFLEEAAGDGHSESKLQSGRRQDRHDKHRSHSRHHRSGSSTPSSSNDLEYHDRSSQKGGKSMAEKREGKVNKHRSRARHHRNRSSSPDSEASADYAYNDRSRSRTEKKVSSKEKSTKNLKHHKHKRRKSRQEV